MKPQPFHGTNERVISWPSHLSRGLDTRPLNQLAICMCHVLSQRYVLHWQVWAIIPWERGGAFFTAPCNKHIAWPKKHPGKLPATRGFHMFPYKNGAIPKLAVTGWFHGKIPKKPWITGGTPIRKPPTTPRTGAGSKESNNCCPPLKRAGL